MLPCPIAIMPETMLQSGCCDFVYIIGPRKGKICNSTSAKKDIVGFRCPKHRRGRVEWWHKKSQKTMAPIRRTYDQLAGRLLEMQNLLDAIVELAKRPSVLPIQLKYLLSHS